MNKLIARDVGFSNFSFLIFWFCSFHSDKLLTATFEILHEIEN